MSRPLRLLTTVARVSQTRLNPTLATTHHRWFSDTPQTDAERMKAEFLAKKATREETPEGKLEKAARNAKIAAAEAERRAEEEDGPNPDAPNPDAPNLDATKEDTTTETTTTADATPKEPTDFSSFIPKMDAYTFKQNLLSFNDGVKDAWAELLAGGAKDVNKNIAAPLVPNPETGTASKEEYMGTTALMAVDPDQSAWERMQARMRDSPVIDEVLKAAGKISSATGIKKAGQKLGDIREDAAEAWETSQNPWVYRISSVWDTLTAEHEHALVVAELRRLDADFDLEEWQVAISENVIPGIIKDYMGGKASKVRPWMGDAVYNKVAAEIKTRKSEGLVFDDSILSVEHVNVVAAQLQELKKGSPIIILSMLVQQINCIKNREGEIVEGSESDIRGNFFLFGFEREFEEETGNLVWKIIDMQMQPGNAYY